MSVLSIRLAFAVGLGLLVATPLLAQPTVGHVSSVDGSVTRLHRFASAIARVGLVLVAGDQVHVEMGRAEITLVDGSLLQLDAHTRVALHAVDRVHVIGGRVFVRSNGPGPVIADAGSKRVSVAPGSAAEITTSNSNDLLVRVVDGEARVESPWGYDAVTATQSAFVSGPTGRLFVGPWVAPRHDAFHQWAGGRTVFLAPPPTFLPYAHPTYRQQEYARVLRSQRSERPRPDGMRPAARRNDARRRDGDQRVGEDRAGDQRGGDHARRGERRARGRDDNTRLRSGASARQAAQRDQRRPAAKPPTVKTRGASAGVAVRPR